MFFCKKHRPINRPVKLVDLIQNDKICAVDRLLGVLSVGRGLVFRCEEQHKIDKSAAPRHHPAMFRSYSI